MPPSDFDETSYSAAAARIRLCSLSQVAGKLLTADVVIFSIGAGVSSQCVHTTADLCAQLQLLPHKAAYTCLPDSQLDLLLERLADPVKGAAQNRSFLCHTRVFTYYVGHLLCQLAQLLSCVPP